MNILLNGEQFQLEQDKSIMELVKSLEKEWEITLENAIVLINDDIVPKGKWKETIILEDNQVEVLSFVSGG